MDRPQADASIDALKIQFIRLVISAFDEADPDAIPDEKIQEWLQKLDIVDQGRVTYLETLTDFLYEGLRPLILRDGFIRASAEQAEESASAEEAPAAATQEEQESKAVAPPPLPDSPFPTSIELPTAVVGQQYSYDFNLEQYYNGHILSPEMEGLDAVRGMEFSFSDLILSGEPKEPGVYDMVLLFLREDKMDRDKVRCHLRVEPDTEALPREIEMPLARVDEEYEEIIPVDRSYKFNFQLEGAAEIGMDFDPDTMKLMGTPTRSGTFYLTLHFTWEGMREKTQGSTIISIEIEDAEDSFWQNIFPDPNMKFSKSLEEHNQIETEDLWLVGASIRGHRHRHLGLHREDDFQIKWSKRLGWSIMAVADGHPEAKFARKGSELASKVAVQVINKRLELFFSKYNEGIPQLLQAQDEEGEKNLKAFLNFTLTTAIYNAFLYIKRFAESETLPLEEFSTSLKIAVAYPLGKKGYFIAGSTIGDGAIGIFHEKKHEIDIIRDRLPRAESLGPHLLTNPSFAQKTKLLNENLSWWIKEDFSYVAMLSSGAVETLFFGEKAPEAPNSWKQYWRTLKNQVFHGKTESYSEKLKNWLENPSENKDAVEDRTIVIMTPKSR